ncbi:MAG TPA: alpha/beta hydrolase-fold protein [Chitinophagaceae bacterium]|nr:alpha/beta hydrolase-fold protein [Chitinophagaceae bacterium]HNU14758.1 alpha/beta hydrolase-fold protein [Chitinophagaceae bacterium]
MKKFIGLIVLISLSVMTTAQDLNLFQKKQFITGNDTMLYRLLLPENYDASKKYPLVFFLHGAGERGNDNEKQLVHGAKLFLKEQVRRDYPAIVVFPQCPQNSFWSNVDFRMENAKRVFGFKAQGEPTIAMKLAQELLYSIMKDYRVSKRQVYAGGLSMGGMGTFEIVRRNPRLFAAAFPICGGGEPTTAPVMKKTKWWVFHGGKDDVVPPELSEKMVDALKAAKAAVKFTLYPDANHNSWDPAFAEPELLSWLFKQKK